MVTLVTNQDVADEDIVISGFSCKFPMSDNMDEFRENLFSKTDLVSTTDDPIWKNSKLRVPQQVGLMRGKGKFDAGYFGIHSKHASTLDVLTRLVMERTYEAIVDAGISPSELRRSRTAVISCAGTSESENSWLYSDVHTGLEFLGHSRAMLANRISFWLDLHATSYALTTMEAGGLEALTIAFHSIRSGLVDAAIVSTVSLVLLPEMSHHYQQLNLLSQDGKTRSFDAAADGYARSDGVAVLLLQKAKCAKRVYATVVHSAAEMCGDRMTPLIAPMREPLISLLERFYQDCGVDPTSIQYLEADGSAVKESDVEELSAVEAVLLRHRADPLLVGSVMSNMGHCNAASSFASICKVLVAMQTGKIPPNLHYQTPCNVPALRDNRLKVVTEATPWTGGLAAINSIGCTGVYAHALLKSFERSAPKQTHDDNLPRLVVASARTQQGLEDLYSKLESRPLDVEFVGLLHNVYSLPISNHLYRGYTILPAGEKVYRGVQHIDNFRRPIWFIFSGMGSQWPGMGRELMKLPVCAATIDECHEILLDKGIDLKHIITTDDPSVFDTILNCFVGIAAIQLALVDALSLLGIVPDGMVGHSVGELGCSYADGCLTREQMLLSAYYRGLASLEADLIVGYMAAIGLGYNQVKDMVPPEVDVACHNSNTSCTISGPVEPVKKFVAELQEKGIFARVVNVANIAYHSRYIKPAAPLLLEYLNKVIPDPKPRSSRWVCSSVPEEAWESALARSCSPEYLTNNLLSSVLFEEASQHVPRDAIAIEVAPHGLLQAILRRSLGAECTNIALTQRGNPQGLHFLLSAIGKIYMAGGMPQVSKLYPPVRFPVSNGTASIAPLVSWDHSMDWHIINEVTQFHTVTGEADVTVSLSHADDRMYAGYVIEGRVLYPTFGYLKVVWEVMALLRKCKCEELALVFEDVTILRPLEVPARGSLQLNVMVQRGSGRFEVCHGPQLVAQGHVAVPESVDKEFTPLLPPPDLTRSVVLERDEVYHELAHVGYQYGSVFRNLLSARLGRQGCMARVQWTDNWVAFGESLLQLALLHSVEHSQSLQLPVALQKVVVHPQQHRNLPQEVEAVYNHEVGVLRCGALELHKLRLARPEQPPPHGTPTPALRFVSSVPTAQQFLHLSLQLLLQNIACADVDVVELPPRDDSELQALQSHYPQVRLRTAGAAWLVMVTERTSLQQGLALLQDGGFLLLSTPSGETWSLSAELLSVTRLSCGGRQLSLFRKVGDVRRTAHVLVLTDDAASWLAQLQQAPPCERLYAVARQRSPRDLLSLTKQLADNPKLTHVRCVFLADASAPPFSLESTLYQQRLRLDLVINVLKGGVWGAFHSIPTQQAALLPFDSVDGVEVAFLGLNLKDADAESADSVEFLEFSGSTSSGQRVMGVSRNATRAQHLTWHVPATWSLEDAATVPLAYATVYYVLELTARLQHGERILVHKGWTSVGQAAISVALHNACTVFTTVTAPEHRTYLNKRFPQLADSQVLDMEQFDTQLLLQTEGRGCTLILNTVSGPKMSRTVRCLATHGRLLQMAAADIKANKTLGMQVFVRNTEVFGVALEDLFSLPPDWQTALHTRVQQGIEQGVVQPLPHQVFPRYQTQQAFRALCQVQSVNRVLLEAAHSDGSQVKQHLFKCDPLTAYLVTGADAEHCVDMAQWLVLRGARHVVLALRSTEVSHQLAHRISLLRLCHEVDLVLLATAAPTTPTSASSLLHMAAAAMHADIGAIFILLPEQEGQEVVQLDVASRGLGTLRQFVCVLRQAGWEACEERCRAGLPALAVLSQDLPGCLHALDGLLTTSGGDPVVLLAEQRRSAAASTESSLNTVDAMLPASLEDLQKFSEDLETCPAYSLQELPSLSPGSAHVKEPPSVFLVSGLQGAPAEVLQDLARQIMFPTLCVRLPESCTSLTDAAPPLADSIQEVQVKGPYNLVGASWGGALTLALAAELEARGAATRVVLLDGLPDTTRSALQVLGEGAQLEENLQARLGALEAGPGLTAIKNRVQAVMSYRGPDVPLDSDVLLVRPTGGSDENPGLSRLFKKTVNVCVVDGDHRSIANSADTCDAINNFVL